MQRLVAAKRQEQNTVAHCTRPLSCCNHNDAREVTQGVPTTFTVLSRAKSIRLIGEVEKSGSHSVNSLFCAAFSSDAYMFLNTILNANHRC